MNEVLQLVYSFSLIKLANNYSKVYDKSNRSPIRFRINSRFFLSKQTANQSWDLIAGLVSI